MILRDEVRRQIELEEEARSLGAVRYRQSRPMPWKAEAAVASEEEADLPPGKQLIRLAVEPTAAMIRQFVEDANAGKAGRKHSAVRWMELADPEEIAYLAARVALNAAVGRSTFQTATRQLGEAIIDHVDMVNFKTKNADGYNGLIRKLRHKNRGAKRRFESIRKLLESEEARTRITVSEKLLLGSAALEMLVEATGLFTVELEGTGGGHRSYHIRPTETVEKWLHEQHARCELLDPMLMPMVVRPRRWRGPDTGGYLRKVIGRKLVKNQSKEYQDGLRTVSMPLVYEAINHIQETPWRINRRILEVMREVWDSGGSLAGLPPREDLPLPAKPLDIDTNEDALHSWKVQAAITYEDNARLHAQRLGVQQRLWIAEKFLNEEAIWFPHSMDFRGRVYPIPATAIHPQADDAGKALLEFGHGLPVGDTGGYWIAVHIANLFGIDKVSFRERVDWTFQHAAELIDSALYPLDGQRFWLEADSPWMALAAAMDFTNWMDKKEAHISHLPIPLDGSNSGLQHFSAMLRDPLGAQAVNLIPSAEPQDIYMTVAARAQAYVDADEDPASIPWKNGKVIRKIAKRPTMTFVYSATRFGMQAMIHETLRDLDNAGTIPHLEGADNYEAAMYLSHVLFKAVSEVVSSASGAMAWLREVSRIASGSGQAIHWTAPDGLPILQAYRNVFGQRVKVHWLGRRLEVTLAVDGSRIDRRGQANGIAPNFVHSLDAAHLRAVARGAKHAGIDYLAVIHDSFGTHAANTDKLVRILRETFVEQYTPDVLAQFRDEVAGQIPEELAAQLPKLPPKGDLDLTEVLHSPYVFS